MEEDDKDSKTANKTLRLNVNNNQADRALPFPSAVQKTCTLDRKAPSCESPGYQEERGSSSLFYFEILLKLNVFLFI